MTYLIKIDSDKSLSKCIEKASRLILEGGIVAFPTESFYGLGADATNDSAIKKIFDIKKRDPNLPILILISSMDKLPLYADFVPEKAIKMGEKFWPGGLTMVFKSSPSLPQILTSGKGKIGIRISDHPVAGALSHSLTIPITATSANKSGEPPCISAEKVAENLGNEIDLILDGGNTRGNFASTVLDVTVDPPHIIREGIVKRKEIIKSSIFNSIV